MTEHLRSMQVVHSLNCHSAITCNGYKHNQHVNLTISCIHCKIDLTYLRDNFTFRTSMVQLK